LAQDTGKILLTADAGIEALSGAYSYLERNLDFQAGSLSFMQTPHHGGRHNVNGEVLNHLLGGKIPHNSDDCRGATFTCVAKEATNHPKKSVINGFNTRGYIYPSDENEEPIRHKSIRYSYGDMPVREGWKTITSHVPFFDKVEGLQG
jgi:hypothetical protein